ncbi:hypothetical protein ACH4LE_12960 [Streptomyces sp. NPDC017413]|uniref:hypothetical protein n=1 Tax=Streptomyces sp. NPDC017413 TaxID=3364994 RepID=UPI0037A52DD0
MAEIRNVALTLSAAYELTSDELSPDNALRTLTLTRWLAVRGASAPQFARATANELASAYGRRFTDKLGFRYNDLEKVADYIHQRWRGGLRDANIACWAFASNATGGKPTNVASATSEWRYHYYESLLLMIPAVLSVPISDLDQYLSDAAGKYSKRATAIMQHLGSMVGEWDKAPGPLSDSPIRTRPFLLWPQEKVASKESTSRALLANPNALDVDSVATMESLLSRTFPADWSAKRAQVVDDYAVHLLSKHLPDGSKASGIFVREMDTGAEFEMDGLIVAGNTAILVEGKGAPLKLASLRGDVRRLKSQFENLISEAWSQLQRDREAMFGSSAHKYQIVRTVTGQSGPSISSTLANVKNVHYVIPTLDGLGEAGSNLEMLHQLGILPESASPWIIAVSDLALVIDTLKNGPELIAYLRFREKWSKHPRIRLHDEIEMLAMFIEGTDVALRVKAAERENAIAFISGGQARFDDYHAYLRGDGPRAERPEKKVTQRVRRAVDELRRVKPQGWFDAAAALLGTPMTCAIAFDTHWTRYNAKLAETAAHLAGDEDASIFVARTVDDWKKILSDEQILDVLSRRDIVWFARRDQKGILHLEWASHGAAVRSFPRWRF